MEKNKTFYKLDKEYLSQILKEKNKQSKICTDAFRKWI